MTFQLRPFQIEDEAWLNTNPKAMLLYDRGLGKTVVSTHRNLQQGVGTHLVLGPNNAQNTWVDWTRDMYRELAPEIDVRIYTLDAPPVVRGVIWDELLHPEQTRQHRLFFCTYGTWLRDAKHLTPRHLRNIDQISADEAHKFRSRKSKLFESLRGPLRSHPYFTFLTGTPSGGRGPHDFWPYLHLIKPRYFSSYWKFVHAFCEVIDGMWGKEIIGVRNSEAFFRILNEYARIRQKTDPDIALQVPPKTRSTIDVEMDEHQYRVYKDLQMDQLHLTPKGDFMVAAGPMELWMKLRQLLVCPAIFDEDYGVGAAFNDLLNILEDADDNDRHTVIFTPFKRAFEPFDTALRHRGYHVSQLSGGISARQQQESIAQWRNQRGVMLCTIPYAEAFELTPARSAYFIGYEWDPNQNGQAEDRLHRLTTPHPVNIYYYRYRDMVDNQMAHVVNIKQSTIDHALSLGGSRNVTAIP